MSRMNLCFGLVWLFACGQGASAEQQSAVSQLALVQGQDAGMEVAHLASSRCRQRVAACREGLKTDAGPPAHACVHMQRACEHMDAARSNGPRSHRGTEREPRGPRCDGLDAGSSGQGRVHEHGHAQHPGVSPSHDGDLGRRANSNPWDAGVADASVAERGSNRGQVNRLQRGDKPVQAAR